MKKRCRKKIRMISLHLFELEQLRTYLEDMAAQGWMLNSINTAWITFTACAPQKVSFFIDIYTKGSFTNPLEIDDQEMSYADFICEYGYELISRTSNYQVFVSHDEQPIPIYTHETQDTIAQREHTIFKFEMINYILAAIIFGLLFIFTLWSYTIGSSFHTFQYNANYTLLFLQVLYIMRGIPSLRWLLLKHHYHMSYQHIKRRDFLLFLTTLCCLLSLIIVISPYANNSFLFYLCIFLFILLLGFFIVDSMLTRICKKYHSVISFLCLLLILYFGNGILLHDVVTNNIENAHVSAIREDSIFLSTRYFNRYEINDSDNPYSYTLYTIKLSFMKNFLINKFLEMIDDPQVIEKGEDWLWASNDYQTYIVKEHHILILHNPHASKEDMLHLLKQLSLL